MDKVYTFDWYDGPRSGVGTLNGQPCYFESQWTDIDGDEDWYKLSFIEQDLLSLELEYWALWKKYEAAWKAGKAQEKDHPFLPEDRLRGEKLVRLLKKLLRINEEEFFVAQGAFEAANEQVRQIDRAEMLVQWIILPAPPYPSRRAGDGH